MSAAVVTRLSLWRFYPINSCRGRDRLSRELSINNISIIIKIKGFGKQKLQPYETARNCIHPHKHIKDRIKYFSRMLKF